MLFSFIFKKNIVFASVWISKAVFTRWFMVCFQATIEERLALLRGASGDKPTDIAGPVESLATLLSQGLQSDDSSILNVSICQHYFCDHCMHKM